MKSPPLLLLALVATLAAGSCRRPDVPSARDTPMPRPIYDPGTGTAVGVPDTVEPLVVFLGDSLTAGYGLAADEAYPAHVERLLGERGRRVEVLNAGVSGDTTAGGLERLDWFLARDPEIVVVELGGNDGLRGQPLAATEANLRAIIERSSAAGAVVVLAGMRIPPNYGPEYAGEFEAMYVRLARDYDLATIPFLLEGVAAEPSLNLPDGLHPNADGHRRVAETVADALEPIVADLEESGAG
jgi:acyl-CoA thioesterase-1